MEIRDMNANESAECRHENGYRSTVGFQCEDCGLFFMKWSPLWIRHELPFCLSIALWNAPIDDALKQTLMDDVGRVSKLDDQNEREKILNRALMILGLAGKSIEDNTVQIQ